MGVVRSIVEQRGSLENPTTTLSQAADWLFDALGGVRTASGVRVTEKTSLRIVAVYAAVRVLAETVASLPLILYRRGPAGKGKTRATDHPLYSLVHDVPNPHMSSFTWRETLVGHVALWGNGFCEIERNGAGLPVGLWPLLPDRTKAVRKNGRLHYVTHVKGQPTPLTQDVVLHVPGLGFDGLSGYSPIALARQALGLAVAAEEYGARFFGNDSRPGGVLQGPAHMSDDAYKRLKSSWESAHRGLDQAHRVAILEEGFQWQQVGVNPRDAQFLELRKMQTSEVARLYRVPPHMIGDLEKATFSNIEHQAIEFVVHTVRPWLVRIEQQLNRQLLPERDRREFFFEFLVDGLLRGDTKSRFEAYSIARNAGTMSANEWRELENLNPIPDEYGDGYGDEYLVPLNMLPASQLSELAIPTGGDEPPDPDGDEGEGEDDEEASSGPESRARLTGRQRRAAAVRRRHQQAYLRVVADAARRVVRRETEAARAAAKRLLGERTLADFDRWVEEFYPEQREYFERVMGPVLRAYAEVILGEAQDEVGLEPGMTDDMERFLRDYLASSSRIYVSASIGQIRTLVRTAVAEAEEELEDLEGRLVARFDEWEETRPGKIGLRETVTLGGAVARVVYDSAGTGAQWVTFGESCPLCEQMAGRIVGRGQSFLRAGDQVEPGGDTAPLAVETDINHPQLHGGCDCAVIAA